jgi:ATP-dependent helicase HrpA
MVAQVQPSWIESAGAHLVKRTYGDAEWDAVRGLAIARETVSLYGRVLSSGRRVNFDTVEPVAARRMFVEEALLRRQPSMPFAFLDRNDATRARLEIVESCLRRRDLLAGEDALVRFYLERTPPSIASTRAFERWWRAEEGRRPHLLDAPDDAFLAQPLPVISRSDYPVTMQVDGNTLHLRYRFDPTSPDDGVTLDVPLPLLRVIDARRLEWLIPGWLREKVIALLRGLPKDVRREFVPIPDAADRLLASLPDFAHGSLHEHIAAFATRESGTVVEPLQVAAVALPPWLHVNVRVLDHAGRPLRTSRDLASLRDELRGKAGASAFAESRTAWERVGVRSWDFGDLPEALLLRSGGLQLRAFPGLQDDGSSVRLHLFTSADAARSSTRQGLVRLAALALPQQHELVRRQLERDRELTLLAAGAGFGRDLLAEIADRAVAVAVLGNEAALPSTRPAFEAALERGRAAVVEQGMEIARVVRAVLTALKEARGALSTMGAPVFDEARSSVVRQLDMLLAPGWVRATPAGWWPQLPKYVRGAARRLDRAHGDVERDRRLQAQVAPYEAALHRLSVLADPERPDPEGVRLRWMLEEYRLSLFAQELKTLAPISARRLDEQLARAQRATGAALAPAGPAARSSLRPGASGPRGKA